VQDPLSKGELRAWEHERTFSRPMRSVQPLWEQRKQLEGFTDDAKKTRMQDAMQHKNEGWLSFPIVRTALPQLLTSLPGMLMFPAITT